MTTMPAIPVAQRSRVKEPDHAETEGCTRQCVQIPASAATFAGFRQWATSGAVPEHVRVAFLNREIYLDMSNEEPESHVGVKTEIARVLSTLVRDLKLGKYYTDGVLVSNEPAGISNNPDGVFLSKESLRSGLVRFVLREGEPGRYKEIEGVPDWIMEIVSDGSAAKDTEELRQAYHRAGIKEYWLVDARGEVLVFQILQWRKKGYGNAPKRQGWQRSRVFPRAFRLNRQRDDLGLWEYTLEVRRGGA